MFVKTVSIFNVTVIQSSDSLVLKLLNKTETHTHINILLRKQANDIEFLHIRISWRCYIPSVLFFLIINNFFVNSITYHNILLINQTNVSLLIEAMYFTISAKFVILIYRFPLFSRLLIGRFRQDETSVITEMTFLFLHSLTDKQKETLTKYWIKI